MYKERKRIRICVFPGYKWCGPGCSGPGFPMNDVDACCRRHDRCLNDGGPTCECDIDFLNCLRPKIDNRTEKGRKAALMYTVMRTKVTFFC